MSAQDKSDDHPTRAARGYSRPRLIAMAMAFVAIGTTVGLLISWWYAPVAGWAASCVVYLAWIWSIIGGLGPAETRSHATREDPGSTTSDVLVLVASVGSLAAVGVVLMQARSAHGALAQGAIAALAVGSVALSWTLVHTLYTLRYARIYYGHPVGGIDFNQDEPPRYSDFAYLAFDLGMTFQVSDTSLQTSQLRSIVLRHTLLSYIFGSVILATTINLVAGLGG